MKTLRSHGFNQRPRFEQVVERGEPLPLDQPDRKATSFVTSHFYLDNFVQSREDPNPQPLQHTPLRAIPEEGFQKVRFFQPKHRVLTRQPAELVTLLSHANLPNFLKVRFVSQNTGSSHANLPSLSHLVTPSFWAEKKHKTANFLNSGRPRFFASGGFQGSKSEQY